MSELFEQLPEVGDPINQNLWMFFDEAHLLFDGAPSVLWTKWEQVVRLIRSKGVGIYFVTQNPLDLPDTVLGQLGNRVQHALRFYTTRSKKHGNLRQKRSVQILLLMWLKPFQLFSVRQSINFILR